MLLKRTIQQEILILKDEFPILVLTGPRQSGKTTLARTLFYDKPYVTLENPIEKEFFQRDPLGFLSRFPDGAIFDEAQNTPDLFSHLQGIVDEDGRNGLFILTGSQQFGLLAKITQSLAGRAGIVELLPFSCSELLSADALPRVWENLAIKGGYPPIHVRGVRSERWYKSYITTYLERDMRQIVNIRNFSTFRSFLKMCASLVGQQVNVEALATACKIDVKTVRSWLGVLEACYLIYLLPPYYKNYQKRLTKAPKLYFYDTGLVCSLLGIKDFSRKSTLKFKGHVFENLVFTELLKLLHHNGVEGDLYFWRDSEGVEVDFVLDIEGVTFAIEAKSGITPKVDFTKTLLKWAQWADLPQQNAKILYGGSEVRTICGVDYLPWNHIDKIYSEWGKS